MSGAAIDAMLFRTARPDDFDTLIRIDAHATQSADRRRLLHRWVDLGAVSLAETASQVLGFVVLEHTFFGRGFVPLICVAPAQRRQGVALALMDHARQACRTDRLFTSTNASHAAAQALFVRAGFEPSGRIGNLDDGDDELVFVRRAGASRQAGATIAAGASALRRPDSVQVFLVSASDDGPRWLLLQRRARDELGLPAFWQGVTGALEAGESHAQAAIREVREETGIALDAVQPAHFEQRFPVRPQWRSLYGPEPAEVREQVFYAIVPPDSQPRLSSEHQAWCWANAVQARALLAFGENRRCAEAVQRCLSIVVRPRSA